MQPVATFGMTHLTTAKQVIAALGYPEAQRLSNNQPYRSVWAYGASNRFPPKYRDAFRAALAARGFTVDPALFGQFVPETSQTEAAEDAP